MTTTETTPAALAMLEDGLTELATSERWKAYLKAQSSPPRYSFGNTMLSAWQRPETTRVAWYLSWFAAGLQVRKKARARSKITQRLTGAAPAHVYDALVRVSEDRGVPVEVAPIPAAPGANGVFNRTDKTITIAPGLSELQMIKTTAHEIAHSILHAEADGDDRALCELEAESVAYVVCDHLGIDSGSYSFGYLAGWAGNDPTKAALALRGIGGRVAGAAKTIIEALSQSSPAEAVAA